MALCALARLTAILAVVTGLWFSSSAQAQCGPSGCGPQLGNCAACRGDCGHFGLKQYPRSEFRYIRQFCKPTINCDSCFGHYKTQWTPWPAACPNWGNDTTVVYAPATSAPVMTAPEPKTPPAVKLPESKPESKLTDPTPIKDPMKDVKDPPKVPLVPLPGKDPIPSPKLVDPNAPALPGLPVPDPLPIVPKI